MRLCDETITFLIFVLLGAIFSIVFDVFRAIRKVKKANVKTVCMQDIIYFFIIGVILLISLIKISEVSFRVYLLLGIVLGCIIYISVIGNKVMNIFVYIIKMWNKINSFIFLPLTVFSTLFDKQINILKKIVVNCCKKISYMINFKHIRSKLKFTNKFKTKEDCINDKNRKQSQ